MGEIERTVFIFTALLFGIGIVLAFVNPAYFHRSYINEDGLLEWLTAMGLFTVTAVCSSRLRQNFRILNNRQKFVLLALAILAVLGGLEELSWAQRLLAIDSPGFFSRHNVQNEINFHNLELFGANLASWILPKTLLAIFLVYLCIITPLYHRSARHRQIIDSWSIPIPQRYQWISYFVIIIVVEGMLYLLADRLSRRGELTEFAVTMITALNIIYPANHAARFLKP